METFNDMMYTILCIICVAAAIAAVWKLVSMLRQSRKERKPAQYQPSSYVQVNTAARQAATDTSASIGYRTIKGFLVKLDVEKQNRYIPGRNAYELARTNGQLRSVIFRDANGLQKLLEEKAGSGDFIGTNKEKIDFGQTIGQYVDVDGRTKRETKVGIIHYTSEGAYIVPARPGVGGVS